MRERKSDRKRVREREREGGRKGKCGGVIDNFVSRGINIEVHLSVIYT